MRIAVIGAGVSGIAAARVLIRCGHQAVLLERSSSIGGVWARAYPDVRLQNVAEHYRFSDVPWPFVPDQHPTAQQIMRYLHAAVDQSKLYIRLQHEVTALSEQPDGWALEARTPHGSQAERFDFVVIASGHYTQDKAELSLPGRERFAGAVLTERDVDDLAMLSGKDIAVVGFGKSAVDMASFAAERGARVHHVFREPRWMVPKQLLGVHSSNLVLARMSTVMLPSWVHPSPVETWLHRRMEPAVAGFWSLLSLMIRAHFGLHGAWRDPQVRQRMRLLVPDQPLPFQMRSALALAPDSYFPAVADGRILPYRSEVAGLSETALELADGRSIPCDMVLLAVGNKPPRFPYLPDSYRTLLESEPDGAQLYRHLLHPRIPRIAFAGFNHGFLHIPGVEIATLWLCAHLRGDLVLPPVEDMERCIAHVRDWKRTHSLFEPSRSYGVNTRFHQYLDVLLADLGVRPYRKGNPVTELLGGYTARDYHGIFDEYERARAARPGPWSPLPLHT